MAKSQGTAVAQAPRIRVTPARRIHILDGDKNGGGHGPGRKIPGKSEFPSTLTDDEIIDGTEDIANDPTNYPNGTIPTSGKPFPVVGKIKGVETQVVVDPKKRIVVTSHPIGIPRNP